jgi:multiple sugar transport system substrate-binding protein
LVTTTTGRSIAGSATVSTTKPAAAATAGSTAQVTVSAPPASAVKSGATIKITYWFWGTLQQKASDGKVVAGYNAAHPGVEVTPVQVPADYVTKFETAVAGDQAPDVFRIDEPSFYRWSCSGLPLDQKPYLDRQKIDPSTRWHPEAQWWYHAKYMGTGSATEPILLYYNNDLFKAAGVPAPPNSPASAWKWDEFVATAHMLTKGSGTSAVWGAVVLDNWQDLLPFEFQLDAMPFGQNFDQSQLTVPSFTDPVQAVADLALKEKVAPLPSDLTGTSGLQAFLTGKVAMYMDGQWSLVTLTDTPPPFDLRIAVIPV